MLAISIGFSNSGIHYVNTGVQVPKAYTTRENMFSITPFVRYYLSLNTRFKLFGQFNAYTGFGTASITYQNPDQGLNGSLMIKEHGAALIPGISFFPNNHLGLECTFSGINYSNWSFSTDENATLIQKRSFSFSLNSINPNIGINYYF